MPRLRTETTTLRSRMSQLESELAMARGAQGAVASSPPTCPRKMRQLKEELAFLQQMLADTSKQPGMSIPRLSFERQSDDVWRYSLLIVRGGNPRDEFEGRFVLQATLQGSDPKDTSPHLLTLPDDQPRPRQR